MASDYREKTGITESGDEISSPKAIYHSVINIHQTTTKWL